MSHIEEGKTNLVFHDLPALLQQGNQEALAQHPCLKLLQQTAALVAKQYGGEVLPYYYDYSYEKQSTNTALAIHIPQRAEKAQGEALPRGIGLLIDEHTGALLFRGDPWMVKPDFYQQVQRKIVQTYTALAHMAALRQMHYQVSSQHMEGQISITGGSYA